MKLNLTVMFVRVGRDKGVRRHQCLGLAASPRSSLSEITRRRSWPHTHGVLPIPLQCPEASDWEMGLRDRLSASRTNPRAATPGNAHLSSCVNRTLTHNPMTCGDSTQSSSSRVKQCVNPRKSDRAYTRAQRDDGRSKEMAPSFLILRRRLPTLSYLCSA